MKTLNRMIDEYTRQLRQGEIQLAYRGILEFMGGLRADFNRRYAHFDVGGVYQGYMDMSYFSLSTELFMEKGLKIAVVYLHEKGCFEAWLSARNRAIAKRYASVLREYFSDGFAVFHDEGNPDAIVESTLVSAPNFDDPALLTEMLCRGAERFIATISDLVGEADA